MSRYKEFLEEMSRFPEEKLTIDCIRNVVPVFISKGYMYNVLHDDNYVLWEFIKASENKYIYIFGVHSSTDLALNIEAVSKPFTKSDLKVSVIGKFYIEPFKRLGKYGEQPYFQKQYESHLPLNEKQTEEYKKICHDIKSKAMRLMS